MKFKSWLCAAAVGVGLLGAGQEASAESLTLNFAGIPSTVGTAAEAEVGTGLRVVVTDEGVGANQIRFNFQNVATADTSLTPIITDIYFQDGTLLGVAQIINQQQSGAYLTRYDGGEVTNPGNRPYLPGGNSITPHFSPVASAHFYEFGPDGNPIQRGIGVGETLGIVFNLLNGMDFSDVRDALNRPPPSTTALPSLRIGMHVQSIGGQDLSASYINVPPGGVTPPPAPPPHAAVPLPATVWAVLALMGGISAKRLRRKVTPA